MVEIKDKIKLLSGENEWETYENSELGINKIIFSDGPHGVRKLMNPTEMTNKRGTIASTCFPVTSSLANTFNVELAYRVGEGIAKECINNNVDVLLAPGLNIKRNPLCGRNFEYFSEDPFLSGKMAASYVNGVQSLGVGACIKHFACNNQETARFINNSIVDERALREIYLASFESAIKEAQPWTVMCAYNKLNGEYCSENYRLLTEILRYEWGFEGFVVSDWGSVNDRDKGLHAGLELQMPADGGVGDSVIVDAIKNNKISEDDLDKAVERILNIILKSIESKKENATYSKEEHHELARKIARECMVLLKNEERTLPIAKGSKIAVVGRYADKINTGDHGSSNVFSPYTVTPYQGLRDKFGADKVTVYNGCDTNKAMDAAKFSDYIIVCVGSDWLQEGEFLVNMGNVKKKPKGSGGDRVSLHIPPEDVELIRAMSGTSKKLIVNIMGGSAYVINDWIDKADAVVMSFYSGLEGGNALAELISGDKNFSGKLPFTIAYRDEDYPDFLHIGAKNKDIEYGYYHGYTLFDKENKEPHFPFGYGLSYTSFSLENAKAELDGDAIEVKVTVKNTGDADGDEIVQVYVGSDRKDVDRPVKLLKGFKRISVDAYDSKETEIEIDLEDIKFYNPVNEAWELDDEYTVYVGTDCRNAAAVDKIRVK